MGYQIEGEKLSNMSGMQTDFISGGVKIRVIGTVQGFSTITSYPDGRCLTEEYQLGTRREEIYIDGIRIRSVNTP